MLRRRFLSVLGAGALGALAGCTSDDDARPRAAGSASPAPTVQDNLPPVTDELSLPALMREDWRAGRIRVVEELGGNSVYSRSRITYGSGDLTISGVLLRPRDEGTYPGIVLNHGYIDPEVYKTGQGLRREQEKLARAGFVVLHTDYRGHADSDPPGARSTRRPGWATPRTPSARSSRCSRSPTSTRTRWRCWGVRWAVR